MDDCLFCKIAAGDIPAKVVYETQDVVAFDDISPQAPVHTLIIPKRHVASLSDDVSSDLLAALFHAVPEVAAIKGVKESGYRVIVNNGGDSQQTVQHLHIHVIGGRPMAHGMVRFLDE